MCVRNHYSSYVDCTKYLLCFIVGGEDYTTTSTNVTFFAGNTSQFFDVPLINDNSLEPTEQFEVVIKAIHLIEDQQPSPPVVIGSTTVANGVIIDNDGKLFI